MNKVYIDEVSEISSGKPLYWEVREEPGHSMGFHYTRFYLRVKTKEDAIQLKQIINNNLENYSMPAYKVTKL